MCTNFMAAIEAGGWVMIIGAVFLGMTQVTSLVLQFMSGRKVEAVRTDLAINTLSNSQKLDGVVSTNKQIHTLVNSNMGVQLKVNVVLAWRIYALTKDPEDLKAAQLAENYLKDHEIKQGVVDKQ